MIKSSVLGIAAVAAASLQASAATLVFEDNFDSNTSGWYRGGTSGNLTNPSGTLSWNPSTAGSQSVVARQFSSTSLAVGETLRVSYTWIPQVDGSLISRVGLLNVGNAITADGWNAASSPGIGGSASGYFTFFRDDSATGNGARYETGSVPSSTDLQDGTSIGSNTTSYNFLASTAYTVVFDVTLTSPTNIQTLLTVSSGSGTHMSVSGSDSAGVVSSFNTVALRFNESTTSRVDNLRVEIIPEPSAALLALVGPAALILRRRRA